MLWKYIVSFVKCVEFVRFVRFFETNYLKSEILFCPNLEIVPFALEMVRFDVIRDFKFILTRSDGSIQSAVYFFISSISECGPSFIVDGLLISRRITADPECFVTRVRLRIMQ